MRGGIMRIALLTISSLAVSVLAGAGCATTTKIVTDPPGATVSVIEKEGQPPRELGKAPLTYESKMWIVSSETLVVKADGKEKRVELKRSEFDMVPGIGSIALGVCLFPTLCAPAGAVVLFLAGGMKLPEETKISMKDAAPAKPVARRPDEAAPLVAMSY
jgi:hypothetical protein